MTDMLEQEAAAVAPEVLDELGQAFERLYHAVSRRTKANQAQAELQAEADSAKQEHEDAWNALANLQDGKTPVVPE
jgi:hypothetical protein